MNAIYQGPNKTELELRIVNDTVRVGDIVQVRLYAVAVEGSDCKFACATAILRWPESLLGLQCCIRVGTWMFNEFVPQDYDGINNTFTDGTAYYHVAVPLGYLADIPADGLLLATFEFLAIAPSDAIAIVLPLTFGDRARTAVYRAGFNVLSDARGVEFPVTAIPADIDGDGKVTMTDLSLLLAGLGKTRHESGYSEAADLNGDGVVDLQDLSILLGQYSTKNTKDER